MKKQSIKMILLVVSMFFSFALIQLNAKTLKMAHSYQTSTAHHKYAVWAAEQIEKRTNGKYKVKVFPSEQLGNAREVEESMKIGAVDIGYIGPGHLAQTYKPISIHLVAFLWRDFDHFMKYPTTSVYKKVTSEYSKISGNQIISMTYFGQRHVTANKPLLNPAEYKNLKMRVPPLPIYMIFPLAVDANATPVNFSELYLALQQGVVVAQENPLPTIKAKKLYEVQNNIMLTGHMTDGYFTLLSPQLSKKLNSADRKIIEDVYKEAAQKTSQAIYQSELDLAGWFRKQGIKVHNINKTPYVELVAKQLKKEDWPWTQSEINSLINIK